MILKRQASCPVMLGSIGELSSKKEKEKKKTNAYPLKLDGKKKRKRRKTLKRQESCPTILSSGGSSYISSASAVSRMGACTLYYQPSRDEIHPSCDTSRSRRVHQRTLQQKDWGNASPTRRAIQSSAGKMADNEWTKKIPRLRSESGWYKSSCN